MPAAIAPATDENYTVIAEGTTAVTNGGALPHRTDADHGAPEHRPVRG